MTKPAPYPSDTRAKGWRFEIDYERVEQSGTWSAAMAAALDGLPLARAFLLATWYAAWKQVPCGSLPADDTELAGAIGLPRSVFAEYRDVLMRGWWKADDGRLYHPTLTERVLEMLEYRDANAKRVAKHKASRREQRSGNALPTDQQRGNNDTGTGTGTGRDTAVVFPGTAGARDPEGESVAPTPAGAICRALRQAGLPDTNPGHPRLLALIEAGAPESEFLAFSAASLKAGSPFLWLLGAVEGERKRAVATAGQIHHGAMPNKQQAIESRNRAVGKAWAAKVQQETHDAAE